MYDGVAELAEGIIKKKTELRNLSRKVAEEEDQLVTYLASKNPSLLQVNWTRVCRQYGITQLKDR